MTAIQAVFVNHKRIPSRKVMQIILEVPEEHQRNVFDVLGYPNSSMSLWVGVARMYPPESETPPVAPTDSTETA
jgi:hypothetical protein